MGVDHSWWDRIRLRHSFALLNIAILSISFGLYLLNEHVLKGLTSNAFIWGHFNDLLAIFLFLPYCNLLLSLYPYQRIRISTLPTCVMVAAASGLGWEYGAPLFLENSVSDPVDLLMYVISGVLYGLLISTITSAKTPRW
jgi:hypothetical protein